MPPSLAQTVAQELDAIAGSVSHGFEIDSRLVVALQDRAKEEVEAGQGRPAAWTVWAFQYGPHSSDLKAEPFAPNITYADGRTNIPRLRDIGDEVLDWWELLAAEVTHPVARARLEHLLFLRRRGNGLERAKAAAECYLDAATHFWPVGLETVDCLRYALDLARRTGQSELAKNVVEAVVEQTDIALRDPDPAPGVLLRLIDIAVQDKESPEAVDRLLTATRDTYLRKGDVHAADAAVDKQLIRARAAPETVANLWQERVTLWWDAADAAEGLIKALHLKKAATYARSSGDPALLERAAARLQETRLEDLGLRSFGFELSQPLAILDTILGPVTNAPTWQEAMLRFGRSGPVSGQLDLNRRTVEEMGQQFVFTRLMPQVLLGGDGLPRFSAVSEEERAEYALSRHECLYINMYSHVVLEALIRIRHRYGLRTEDELADYFAGPAVPPDLARAIARAYLRFWMGDAEGAAFTVTPRIEAIARNLLLSTNVGIYKLQREKSPGQYPGLKVLLDGLTQQGLDPSWGRFIHTLCTNPAGYNVRNELSHGFLDGMGDAFAALLLQVAAYLASFGPDRPSDGQAGSDSETGPT